MMRMAVVLAATMAAICWAAAAFVAVWGWSAGEGFEGRAGLNAAQFWGAYCALVVVGWMPLRALVRWLLPKRGPA